MPGDASASKIVVPRPEAGLSVQIPVWPGNIYALDFDHLDAFFDQDGQNMQLSFPDGALLTLQGFCNATASDDITLELQDGTQISGIDLVETLSMPLQDIHTDAPFAAEAGGAATVIPSGGATGFSSEDAGYCDASPSAPLLLVEQTPFAVWAAETAKGGMNAAPPVIFPLSSSGTHAPRLEDLLDDSGAEIAQAEFLSALDKFSPASGDMDVFLTGREDSLPGHLALVSNGTDMVDENLDYLLALLCDDLL
jgi:hypothetical protein